MRISKHALKRLRHWSKYHSQTTVYEAHEFLKRGVLTTSDYDSIRDLVTCAVEIRDYLTKYCGYEMLTECKIHNGVKYRVLRNRNVSIIARRARDNYVAALTGFYESSRRSNDI